MKARRDQAAAERRLRLAGARREDIAELEAQTASVAVDLEDAGRDLQRMQALLADGVFKPGMPAARPVAAGDAR